ncbi:alpha-glucosidase [Halogeometricum pallidum JCM 14848]|uniref:Alpha-glucosidase n=1 Tax=Halogeometricum pallidum JCM 14848 TaxID=1227487 RepID=M0CYS5_HALPD|nr:glycoside hydrolase family 97 catalytic domain-containing protein [Halogeometricum pallidum]ELZ27019.1 alpha-glucosidase [Halogeometricum pallidum JCM 14848]
MPRDTPDQSPASDSPDSSRSSDSSDPLLERREFVAGAAAVGGLTSMISGVAAEPIESTEERDQANVQSLTSPGDDVEVTFEVVDGAPTYAVAYDGETVVERSTLGLAFRDDASLDGPFEVTGAERRSGDETWEPVWGASDSVRNRYEELAVGLRETEGLKRSLNLLFRAYDDGAAFRYVLPEQENFGSFVLTDERTEFAFAGDYTSWWTPDDWENYEYLYEETPLSEIQPTPEEGSEVDGANTPVTMRVDDEAYVSVHEAALTDYAGMTLTRADGDPTTFESTLVPWPDGDSKVKAEAPHVSPWRTFTLGSNPGALVESDLLVNLNEPNELDETDWIEPQKYMGIWWEIHIGKSRWAPGPDVGATTENAKRYIDFASEHGIASLLVEGWNVGWEGGFDSWSNAPYEFSFTESTEHYDLQEVVEYGQSKEPSVNVVAHNETGGGVGNYEAQLEEAFSLYEDLGIHAIKTGYVSEEGLDIDDETYHHHGQRMVNHYRHVTKKAAEHEIMLDVHEPIKPTGVRRTYPNLMTREGVSGLEYENFRPEGNPPSHTLTLPFTRMVAGPLDYTPGAFDILYEEYGTTRVHSTVARQLALYPMLLSGLQMVADLPEHYDDLDAFEFVEQVPASWDETVAGDAEIGDYATIARRKGEEWYVGTGTDDTPRALSVPLDFLGDNREYVAEVYADGPEADYESNPEEVAQYEFLVSADDTLHASMVAGGGQAVRLRPPEGGEQSELSAYEPPAYEYDTPVVPAETMAGEPFTVLVEASNAGGIVGGERMTLSVDGETVDEAFVRVGAGEETQVEFPLRLSETGDHEVTMETSDGDASFSKTVTVAEQSAEFRMFSYEGFEVPEETTVGKQVEIPVTVTNTGDEESLQVVKLTVDDDVVEVQGVDLQPGDSTDLAFWHTFESPGEYEVAVEDLDAQTVTVNVF